MEKELRVGDRVRIKSWEQMKNEFGTDCRESFIKTDCGFITEMKHLCDKRATVNSISGKTITLTDWSETNINTSFVFSTDMVELVADKDIKSENCIILLKQ